ncbi:nucleoside deaminase [Cryptosporangium phraense]|uniref:Nucleoside deaminase n=1 Tax=Cryptosporangium phraense TaxID=2593070 RepID=A0A545AJ11_9ACTN|nr:nucleoside deaminase [Cryptosporangium phraense]TQS40675.1 nucleoside deaminase [Cryptosporangium phraense]
MITYLERCVELAEEALARGDGPFGSVLVDADGRVLHEDSNREASTNDPTAHPEFALARWAAANLPEADRATATVYTSGEHCPMCAAAHGWAGLGRIVYAASGAQLASWRESWGLPASPVRPLAITDVAPGIPVVGPVPPFDDRMRAIHRSALPERQP